MRAMGKSSLYITIFGNDKSKKAFDSFNKSTNQANQQIKRLAGAVAAAFSVREIVEAANVMIGVENRMNALTGSAEKTAEAMNHMRRIASDSRSDFDAVAMLYTRLALATEHLGATQQDVADATQTVANTFIIAGSHAQEANNSARQLAQGLASGALRGDELRSVMENNTILTKMLAEGLNMTIGELREFGHAGKLTAETVMPILIAGMKETNEQITKMPMTLGQAGVALRNNFQFIIGDVQKATNGFSTLSAAIGKVANNLDVLFIPALGALILALPKVKAGILGINLALQANPFVRITTAVVAFISTLYLFRNEIVNGFRYIFQKSLPNIIDGFLIKWKTFQKMFSFGKKDKELDAEISAIGNRIEERTNKVFEKIKVPSFMDILLGRDPNKKKESGGTGATPLTALQQFLMDAEKGYKDFFTNIKTMQEEMQGVFQKSYDGLTKLTTDFLENGKASFKDFATSVVRELIRIAVQKLIIDKMFAGFGSLFSSGGMSVADIKSNLNIPTSIPSGDGGGYTGMGARAGGVDGKGGFPAILHPNETIIDHTKGQGMGTTVNFNISTVDAAGFDQLLASRKGLIRSMINNAMNNQGKMGVV